MMPGCGAIRFGPRAQAHFDPCRVRVEERLKTTPEGPERLDGRSEVFDEALTKGVERKATRVEEIESATGDRAVPREFERRLEKRKRRAMKEATMVEQWRFEDGWQPRGYTDADTSKFDGRRVKNGRRGRRERRIQNECTTEGSRMNDEEEKGDEF